MARFAPATCSPCAIAQAIERLLATPKTTAVRPFKSSNMKTSPGTKSIRIAGDEVPCVSPVPPVVKVFSANDKCLELLRRRSHSLRCPNRPAGAPKRHRINCGDHAKPRRQADPRCDPAHRQPQHYLQKGAKKIKTVLHPSHKLRRHLF